MAGMTSRSTGTSRPSALRPSSPELRAPAGTAPRRRRATGGDHRLALALPAAAILVALALWPLVQLGSMSLHEVTAATLNGDWLFVWLDNYARLFASPDFPRAVGNTLVFVAVVTVLGMVGGFAVAVAVSSPTRGASYLLGMMVFVWALPPVVNGSIWKFLLGDRGLLNEVIRALGGSPAGIGFLYDPQLALWSVALVNAWAVIPFNALIFRAALLAIDSEVLEAAEMDGAGPWQRIRYVLIPHVRPTATVLAILTVVYAFRSFDFIYVMTSGGPGTSSTTLPYLAYVEAFLRLDYGQGAATALIALAVVVVLALFYARDVRRSEEAS
jgi:ABC-type sugar transport system permease subunit